MSATNRGKVRQPLDYYATPRWCISALTAQLRALRGRYVLDPCAGDGRIGQAFEAMDALVTFMDLKPQAEHVIKADFLAPDWEPAVRYAMCVANPPYRHAEAFLRRALQCAGCVALLLRVNFLGSKGRVPLFRQHPPVKLIVMGDRPSFIGNTTDATEYAWFIWGAPDYLLDRTHITWALRAEHEGRHDQQA